MEIFDENLCRTLFSFLHEAEIVRIAFECEKENLEIRAISDLLESILKNEKTQFLRGRETALDNRQRREISTNPK